MTSIRWEVLLTVLLVFVTQSSLASVCFIDANQPLPPLSEQARELDSADIEPQDVFDHLQSVAYRMEQHGLVSKQEIVMPVQEVSPRSNLLLAHDLFYLVYLWHQTQNNFFAQAPDLIFLQDVQPYHVYQWVDATDTLLECIKPTSDIPRVTQISRKVRITPQDVLYLLENLKTSVMQHISKQTLEAFISMRILQIHYLLQSILVDKQTHFFIDWELNQRNIMGESLLDLTLQSLNTIAGLTNTRYLSPGNLPGNLSIQQKERMVFLSLALIYGELKWLNITDYQLPTPPMLPINNLSMNDTEKLQRLSDISRLLTILAKYGETE